MLQGHIYIRFICFCFNMYSIRYCYLFAIIFNLTFSFKLESNSFEKEDNDDEFKGIEDYHPSRSKRDLSKLEDLLIDIAGSMQVFIPELKSLSFLEHLTTAVKLLRIGFNNLQCCYQVGVPTVLMYNLEKCGRDPLVEFITKISKQVKERPGEMVEPIVSSTDITNLVDSGMCIANCAFTAMNLTKDNGLPNIEKMIEKLPSLVNTEATEVMTTSLQKCSTHIENSLKNSQESVTKRQACWASNTLLDCLKNHVYQECPASRKQNGTECLVKLGTKFWNELPGKIESLYLEMAALF